jgi:hypothetical protein
LNHPARRISLRSASARLNSTLTMMVNFDQAWIIQSGLLGPVVEAPAIRLLIREKLKDGRLPYDSMPRFWGGAGNGEQCDACDEAISKDELVMEGIASTPSNKKPIQFHVVCFQLWDTARRAAKS